jgi:hypothetical protein
MRDVDGLGHHRQLGTKAVTFPRVYLDSAPRIRWDHVNFPH